MGTTPEPRLEFIRNLNKTGVQPDADLSDQGPHATDMFEVKPSKAAVEIIDDEADDKPGVSKDHAADDVGSSMDGIQASTLDRTGVNKDGDSESEVLEAMSGDDDLGDYEAKSVTASFDEDYVDPKKVLAEHKKVLSRRLQETFENLEAKGVKVAEEEKLNLHRIISEARDTSGLLDIESYILTQEQPVPTPKSSQAITREDTPHAELISNTPPVKPVLIKHVGAKSAEGKAKIATSDGINVDGTATGFFERNGKGGLIEHTGSGEGFDDLKKKVALEATPTYSIKPIREFVASPPAAPEKVRIAETRAKGRSRLEVLGRKMKAVTAAIALGLILVLGGTLYGMFGEKQANAPESQGPEMAQQEVKSPAPDLQGVVDSFTNSVDMGIDNTVKPEPFKTYSGKVPRGEGVTAALAQGIKDYRADNNMSVLSDRELAKQSLELAKSKGLMGETPNPNDVYTATAEEIAQVTGTPPAAPEVSTTTPGTGEGATGPATKGDGVVDVFEGAPNVSDALEDDDEGGATTMSNRKITWEKNREETVRLNEEERKRTLAKNIAEAEKDFAPIVPEVKSTTPETEQVVVAATQEAPEAAPVPAEQTPLDYTNDIEKLKTVEVSLYNALLDKMIFDTKKTREQLVLLKTNYEILPSIIRVLLTQDVITSKAIDVAFENAINNKKDLPVLNSSYYVQVPGLQEKAKDFWYKRLDKLMAQCAVVGYVHDNFQANYRLDGSAYSDDARLQNLYTQLMMDDKKMKEVMASVAYRLAVSTNYSSNDIKQGLIDYMNRITPAVHSPVADILRGDVSKNVTSPDRVITNERKAANEEILNNIQRAAEEKVIWGSNSEPQDVSGLPQPDIEDSSTTATK